MKAKSLKSIVFASCALALIAASVQIADAQDKKKKPVRVSPYSEITQRIGSCDVRVTYHRPGVKGREIWGTNLAPYGGKPMPWRAGANENTVMEFECDVTINGEALAAGSYGFHIIPSDGEWILIWSNDAKGWGSFAYKEANDALRITITPADGEHEEWLRYGFSDLSESSATCYLAWEKKRAPFKIELAN